MKYKQKPAMNFKQTCQRFKTGKRQKTRKNPKLLHNPLDNTVGSNKPKYEQGAPSEE